MHMRRTIKILLLLSCFAAPQLRCVQKYNSPYTSPSTGYLVVEGYICGNGPTQFTLSRTIPLPGDSAIPMETGAKVQVEGNDNTIFPLAQQGSGIYGIDTLSLNPATQYRLRINTSDGEQYLSDYVPYVATPPIDSISWVYSSAGVNIYANTHDPSGNIRYFQWNYTETWQYTSAEFSIFMYDAADTTVIPRPIPADQIYNCWMNDNSTQIILGNSAKLAQADIYDQPIIFIPIATQRLSVLYTIIVRQYALTEAAYNFLYMMKQNSEALGTIFDPQPSQLTGNIQCLTNPGEPVVGYVSAGAVQQQRIWISRTQVLPWSYVYACTAGDRGVALNKDTFYDFFNYYEYIPVSQPQPNGPYLANGSGCIDCRLQGGTTQEPAWWPN
jgi:hypothetical protein